MQNTDSRGVDVAVNSLSGDLLHETWRCVAEGGNMIELGRREIAGHGMLDLGQFDGNRSFHGVDIAALIYQKPKVALRCVVSTRFSDRINNANVRDIIDFFKRR